MHVYPFEFFFFMNCFNMVPAFFILTLHTEDQRYIGDRLYLRNQCDQVGGVGKMIMFYAKKVWFTNKELLQGGWVIKRAKY